MDLNGLLNVHVFISLGYNLGENIGSLESSLVGDSGLLGSEDAELAKRNRRRGSRTKRRFYLVNLGRD